MFRFFVVQVECNERNGRKVMTDCSRGNTAEVSVYSTDKVCKLFYAGIPYEYVLQEFENAKKSVFLGICVPEPFEIIERNGRYGIIYEQIHGVPMRECMKEEYVFEQFIIEHTKILNLSSDQLISYKDLMIAMLQERGRGDSGNLIEEILALPDGNTVLHGDYHPGNIMITAQGELVVIDLLNMSCGPREYDVARTFFLLENETWQDKYLEGMGHTKQELEQYLKIIRKVRKWE